MSNTPILALTEWAAAQASPWLVENSAKRALEFFAAGGAIEDRDLSAPPGSPSDGQAYLVKATGTGAWSGHDGDIALYASGWLFFDAKEGMALYVKDEDVTIVYDGSAWHNATLSGGAGTASTLDFDTDGTLAANSDTRIATQKAVKTAIATAVTGLLDLKGSQDCSANPNYPAASKGDYYIVSVAGKIGGGSGTSVDVGDVYFASADNAGGTEASVGTSWAHLEHNLAGVALLAGATFTGDVQVPDDAYDATTWNASTKVPTKNAVRDKIEALAVGIPSFTSTTDILTATDTTKVANADSIAALWEQGADVASAGTTSLGEGGYFHVTGTTTITDIDFATDHAGRTAWVEFTGILTLTHNASTLILPTGANITTAAGDTACFVSEGSDAIRCVAYVRASGEPLVAGKPTESIMLACSDVSTAITTGTAKITFRMPYAFTVTDVRASVNTAPTGSTILIDINESGTTILSTKLMIDATEKTSTTAATPAVISDASLADDSEITIDFDQVGSTVAGAGVKVVLIGHRT